MRVGQPRRLLDRRHAGAGPGIGDVLGERAVKQDRVLLHDGDLAAQRLLRGVPDVLAVDQDPSAGDVVQPLHQFYKRGLAGTGAADQADPLTGADIHREPLVQRRAVAAIVERHFLEHDAPAVNIDRRGIGGIGNADRLVMDGDELLHVVDRTLQVVDVHADIAQIGVDDVVAGQHVGDVAGRGAARHPQQQGAPDHGGAQAQQHRELGCTGVIVTQPGPPHARPPAADDARQPDVLARFGAEGFHHGVAGQGIGQRAADLGVPGIGDPCCRRDIARREHHDHRNVDRGPDRDHQAERRPVQPEQDHRPHQHRQRGQQRHQDGVVEQIERPHAAGDLAHGRAGEAVGVPVGGEALQAHEGVARHVGHDPQRERHDRLQPDQAQHHRGEPQRHDRGERRQRRPARRRVGRSRGHGVDQMAGEYRHEQVGHRGSQQAAGNHGRADRLREPVAEHEGQHQADGGGAYPGRGGHGVIRLRSRTRRLR